MNYYPHHIGDYASATAHLSMLEDAAYRRLIDWYYLDEAPIPADSRAIYRRVRATSDAEREAVDVVLDEFFVRTDDGYTHKRCDAEIAASRSKSDARRDAANRSWKNRRMQDAPTLQCKQNANAPPEHAIASQKDAFAMHTQEPIANSQTTTEHSSSVVGAAQPPPARARATRRCPDAFAVTGAMADWAASEAFGVDVDRETAKFRDHTFGKAIVDWPATWRNWIRRAADERRTTARPVQQSPPRMTPSQHMQTTVLTGLIGRRPESTIDADIVEIPAPKSIG